MDELLSGILGLACVLSFLALLLHGGWVALGWLYRLATGQPMPWPSPVLAVRDWLNSQNPLAKTPIQTECPRCATRVVDRRVGCPLCGWPQVVGQTTSSRRALMALRRQIERYRISGVLQEAACSRFVTLVDEELAHLAERQIVGSPVATVPPALQPAAAGAAIVDEGPIPLAGIPAAKPQVQAELVMAEIVDEPLARTNSSAPIELWASDATSPAERVEEFVRRQAAQRAIDESPSAVSAPRPAPRLPQLLAAFLEQKHIRWGELVGGLLIVCCSIALVISFWSRIADMPVLKFLVFNGVTASLFGLGFYSSQRWKLPTTSHGLYVIATLLVPLNFLAIAAFTTTVGSVTPLTIAGEVLTIALFAVLVFWGGRAIVDAPAALAIGVLGPSIGQLAIRRFVRPDLSVSELAALAAAPTACYLTAAAWGLLRARRGDLNEARAGSLFTLLGIVTLATVLPLGLLLVRSEHLVDSLHRLAPVLSLLGAPYLACGLLFWRGVASRDLTAVRTAATAIGVLGAMLMLGSIALAWPSVSGLLITAAVNAMLFVLIAFAYRIPEAHLPGSGCLAVAWLLAAALARGAVDWHLDHAGQLLDVLIAPVNASVLTMLVVLLAVASWLLGRIGRDADGRWFRLACLALATVSLLVAGWYGLGRTFDGGATWLFTGYAIAALWTGVSKGDGRWCYAGSALALIALIQAGAYAYAAPLNLTHPWAAGLIVHATLGTLLAVLASRDGANRDRTGAAGALITTALATAAAATVLVVVSSQFSSTWRAMQLAWLAAILTAATWRLVWPQLIMAVQAAVAMAAVFGVIAFLETRVWFLDSPMPWLDPWTIQAIVVPLALLSVVWAALSLGAERLANQELATFDGDVTLRRPARTARQLFAARPRAFEYGLLIALMACATGLALYGAMPGVAQELAPRGLASHLVAAGASESTAGSTRLVPPLTAFEFRGVPHQHALQLGTWLLLAALAGALLVQLREKFSDGRILGLVFLAYLACPLLAGWLESQVAAASALRWFTAGFLLLVSIGLWMRERVKRAGVRSGWPTASEKSCVVQSTQFVALALVALPLAAMGAYVALAAISIRGVEASVQSMWNSLAILFVVSGCLGLLVRRVGTSRSDAWRLQLQQSGLLLLVLGAGPIIAVTLYAVSAALRGNPVVGPEPGSFFARIGLAASYATPVAIMALTLIGHAIRERSSAFAFAAGLLLNVAATAALLLTPVAGGLQFDAEMWVKLSQLNMLVSSSYAVAWLAATRWVSRRHALASRVQEPLLTTQVSLGLVIAWFVLISATWQLWYDPILTSAQRQLGQPLSWCAVGLTLAAAAWLAHQRTSRLSPFALSIGLTLMGLTACFALERWDTGNWLTYHAVLTTFVAGAWLAPLHATYTAARTGQRTTLGAGAVLATQTLAALAVAFAVRAGWSDPQRPWWSLAALGALAVLSACQACWRLQRRYFVTAALLLNVAATIGWLNVPSPWLTFNKTIFELLAVNIIAGTLPALIWLTLDLRVLKPSLSGTATASRLAVHGVAANLGVAGIVGLAVVGVLADFHGASIEVRNWLLWLALASTTAATFAGLWDVRIKSAAAGLYLAGLASIGIALDQFNLSPRWLVWTGAMILAAYTLATSYLWSRRDGLGVWRAALGMPVHSAAPLAGLRWLLSVNGLLIASVVALATWVNVTFPEQSLRLLTGKAAITQAIALALLARGERRSLLQLTALSVGVLGSVIWGWAWIEPKSPEALLNRLVVASVALAAMTAFYGLGLTKILRRENEWSLAGGRLVPMLAVLTAASLGLVLIWEVRLQVTLGRAPMAWPAIVAVAAALLTVALAALAAAVLPGRDPLGLSERGRTLYVYVAEGALALLFMHLRLTMPWLFEGLFQRYWPFIVMLIAFVGVGLAEFFQRRRQHVLSEPLEYTAILLPVLPLLGFWATPVAGHYSALLLAVGAMYGFASALKKSFAYGLLAVLATNGSLWYLLHHAEGLSFADHPQLWLIPPSLCVLAAAYLNRDRLSESQITSVRYLCSATIYVSSTADIFLTGVANAPWLPLVLAGLSVAGVFLGIFLRVRAFLFLGTAFLVMALGTLIWHAAYDLNHTWIWSVCGIVAGMLIIAMFALFEKKRQEVLHLIDQFKEWDG